MTLGDDLTPAQEQEVLKLLGASRQDRTLRITSKETVEGSKGIIDIPPGTPAISSTSIVCQRAGSGIDVRTRNIEEVTAGMYAQALLTAGITDAQIQVVAPSDARAEGLTALTGVFKAYRLSPCVGGKLDPERERLAQRELALTVDLGESLGDRQAASELVLNTQEQVVARKLRGRDEIQGLITQQLRDRDSNVPSSVRNRLTGLMVELGSPQVDWGGYSKGWTLRQVDRNHVRISARPAGQGTEDNGATVRGTVTQVSGNRVTVRRASGGAETIRPDAKVEVVRNGQPATLAQLQPTDQVTVERNTSGNAVRIVATSAGRAAVPSVITGEVARKGAELMRVSTGQGAHRDVRLAGNTAGLEVVRNGRMARLGDVQRGDRVTVTLRADGTPSRIVATSGATAGNTSASPNPGLLLLLLPLF
ncbi:MAG: DUF1002 domain-containing protein, partial [Chloroflexota bacterium]|nr:DUF1002 domain-containing protein [Chloroflexota bacterium]